MNSYQSELALYAWIEDFKQRLDFFKQWVLRE